MKSKIIILLLVLFTSSQAFASKPRIVTSITPIASIVAMLTENDADIIVINSAAGCPHHYQMRPSDKEKIIDSQMMILIDDDFDSFAAKLAIKYKGTVIKLSDLENINFLDENGEYNWHFWLDLKNVLAMHEYLATMLVKQFPQLEHAILANKNKARASIESLMQLKKHDLESINEIVVLSDSFEHFLKDMTSPVIKLYQKSHSSLKNLDSLEYTLSSETKQCIVIDSMQDSGPYEKYGKKIIQIDSENWVLGKNMSNSYTLFCTKYLKMINQLKDCR